MLEDSGLAVDISYTERRSEDFVIGIVLSPHVVCSEMNRVGGVSDTSPSGIFSPTDRDRCSSDMNGEWCRPFPISPKVGWRGRSSVKRYCGARMV